MKALRNAVSGLLGTAVIVMTANQVLFALLGCDRLTRLRIPVILLFLLLNLFPPGNEKEIPGRRLTCLSQGCRLLVLFLLSLGMNLLLLLVFKDELLDSFPVFLGHLLAVFLTEAAVFWNGIIRVYLSSFQLGVRWRTLGILCGFIPILNLAVLIRMIQIGKREVTFETERSARNRERKDERICELKYPILLVHGVFFRDFKYLNYWGRIPRELEENGAVLYYGCHQSAASVADSGAELADRIREVLKESGCEKVNLIAHSKGGLDCRYAVSRLGMAPYVASLTTINTPHRGCLFADYLLEKLPDSLKNQVASKYNYALRKLGDQTPDFMAAVTDLTASACRRLNEEVPDSPDVFYQSVGSKLNRAGSGRFPLNFSHRLVRHFDGPNDGLVAERSFPWGSRYQLLTVKGKRGISHGDMIDLNREDIPDFDVREFYVKLVKDLKERGF